MDTGDPGRSQQSTEETAGNAAAQAHHHSQHHHRPGLGIAFMLLTGFGFVSLDTLAKHLSVDYPTAQVVWARYAFHVALMLPVALWLGPRRLFATRRPWLQLLRGVLLLAATVLFFTALRYLPLATATSIAFIAPLLVTALSVPLLGEHVGPRRWIAVCVGFCGMLIIVRPGVEFASAAHWATLLPAAMAVCYALYQIGTRVLGPGEDAFASLFYTAVVGAVATSVFVPFHWTAPDTRGWLLMALLGGVGGCAHLTLIRALSYAPASLLAPFQYVNLVWATVFGFVVFADLPDWPTLLGAAVIVGSGLFVYYREARAPAPAALARR